MLALPVSRYTLSIAKFCVLTFYLFMEMVVFLVVFVIAGGGCNTDNGNNRNLTDPVSVEMVLGIVSDNAAMYCGYVGNHRTV